MRRLRYCTVDAVERLRDSVSEHLDWYFWPAQQRYPCGFRESKVETSELADQLVTDNKKPQTTDAKNALVVYKSLQRLTPHQASIERLWVYLCHFECAQYVSARWLYQRPDDEKNAVQKIGNHFFAAGNRALIRDNGISRLWWLGKIANDAAPENPTEFLTILLHRQDVRSALIERPSISMNPRLLREIYTVMREHWVGDKVLFERDVFRGWMIALNRRGGVILMDALPEDGLRRLLRDEAKRAINS